MSLELIKSKDSRLVELQQILARQEDSPDDIEVNWSDLGIERRDVPYLEALLDQTLENPDWMFDDEEQELGERAWAALGFFAEPSSIPILVKAYHSLSEDHEWQSMALSKILSGYGAAILPEIFRSLREELFWKEDDLSTMGLVDILSEVHQKDPGVRSRLHEFYQERLERYHLQTSLVNGVLIAALANVKPEPEDIDLVKQIFREDHVDKEFVDWSYFQTEAQLTEEADTVEPMTSIELKSFYERKPLLEDKDFESLLRSWSLLGHVFDRKASLFAAHLVSFDSEDRDDLFSWFIYNHFEGQLCDFVEDDTDTMGRRLFLQRQFDALMKEWPTFRNELCNLSFAKLKIEPAQKADSRLSLFFSYFLDGLNLLLDEGGARAVEALPFCQYLSERSKFFFENSLDGEWNQEIESQAQDLIKKWNEQCPAFFDEVRRTVQEYNTSLNIKQANPNIGRNDPCPCGSGKKFKKCCAR